jgi:molybdenum cofactor cytidylyltransferase
VSDTTRTASLTRALGLERPPGVVAIVGGGGKSSLMFALAGALPGRTVMTTTTRIFAAQMDLALEVCTLADAGWRDRLDTFEESLLVVGRVEGDRAVGVPRELPAELCRRDGIDQVVVEADGSRMRPVKAPAAHEPVIPDATGLLVAVAGIDALSGPIREVAHRPERVGAITGLDPEQTMTPDALARLLTAPEGGLKGAPPAARVAVLINKVESPAQRDAARRVARGILREPRVERVAIGALQGRPAPDWETCLRRSP